MQMLNMSRRYSGLIRADAYTFRTWVLGASLGCANHLVLGLLGVGFGVIQ